MGILDRISTILRANVNAMLDSAEDPAEMIDQIIRDQEEAIKQARGQVAEMIADEKRLESEAEENEKLAEEWGRKAELAVGKGADDLAREALHRQRDYEGNAQVYRAQWHGQQEAVAKLKNDLRALEDKYENVKRQRDSLIARHRGAQAQRQVREVSANLSISDPTAELARMEDRIEREEALAQAHGELAEESYEAQFERLERDDEIDQRLAALKAKAGNKQLPPQTENKGS
ncbi:MAG: PspA/IM30 family protein [Chloroflexota bacterium]